MPGSVGFVYFLFYRKDIRRVNADLQREETARLLVRAAALKRRLSPPLYGGTNTAD